MYWGYVRWIMISNWITCELDRMSGCFIPETQKGLRIITTYLFSPLQYAILLIFFREFWRSRKKIETSYSASTLRDQQLFYHSIIWFGLSIKFAYLISFSLYWKILHRISDQITENKSIWYTKMVKKIRPLKQSTNTTYNYIPVVT